MKYIITENRLNKFLGIVGESKINDKIFLFLDSYLEDYSPEETNNLVLFGKGKENKMAYEKGDQILFVTDQLFELVKIMFNLSKTGTKEVFKDYLGNMGYRVKRFM
jgi:hypothetical protein